MSGNVSPSTARITVARHIVTNKNATTSVVDDDFVEKKPWKPVKMDHLNLEVIAKH